MNIARQQRKVSNVILIALLALTTMLGGCASTQTSAGPAPDKIFLLEGQITKIITKGDITTITIKPQQGEVVVVQATPATTINNWNSINELYCYIPIVVQYRVEGGNNIAVMLGKMHSGACS